MQQTVPSIVLTLATESMGTHEIVLQKMFIYVIYPSILDNVHYLHKISSDI